jgi:hypothetical protein
MCYTGCSSRQVKTACCGRWNQQKSNTNVASTLTTSYYSSDQHVKRPQQSEQSCRSLDGHQDCTQTWPNARSHPSLVVRTRSQTSSTFWAAKFRTSQSGTWACRLPQRRFRGQDSNPWCSRPQTATKPPHADD